MSEKAKTHRLWTPRLEAFLLVFEPLLERYEAELKKDGDVDFNDMILRAADYAESGRYRSPYTCILVERVLFFAYFACFVVSFRPR